MEALRSRIKGTGNLERFDYWANFIQEIRAFVLSRPKCGGLNLYWRPLGGGAFRKVSASHQARQAYRVSLPARSEGTLEYYLEAKLADGQKVIWPATAPDMCQTVIAW